MPEEPKGQEEVVEKKQPEGVSTSEQTQEKDVEELPEDSSERTREQFEKLKESNSRLAEENRQLREKKPLPSVLDSLKPEKQSPSAQSFGSLNQGQVDDIYTKLVDDNGYIDQNLLVRTLKEANDRAAQAEMRAKQTQERFEEAQESQQVQSAHSKYPQLDPKGDDFDEKFYNLVKNEMIGQLMNGKQDFVAAADTVSQWYSSPKEEDTSKADAQKKEQQVRQIQATATAPSGTKLPSDQDELVTRTQQGDRAALMERLKRIGA